MLDRETPLTASKAGNQWKTIGVRHHHGINIPLFALHSQESAGIGEFLDLCPLIEWCNSFNFDVIQLLPLNDSGSDKSPYNALSAFALNPIYISLSQIPRIQTYESLAEKLEKLKNLTRVNPLPYEQVRTLKEEFLHIYWQYEFNNIEKTNDYTSFLVNNASWIREYALFKVLKNLNQEAFWKSWPVEQQILSQEAFDLLFEKYRDECSYYQLVQFICHTQLKYVKDFATSHKVFLMGDLPILISPDSADAWRHQDLFISELSAGAPPDMYNKEGQHWGFPLYNWSAFEANRYAWWKNRLRTAEFYYHLFRIDHVVGFFRIWAIPAGMKAINGHFEPSDEAHWLPQGKTIMECMLEGSCMLPIGEDLGVVPTDVRKCLRELGICGTKVMRWERLWDKDSSFIPIHEYIPESLTTVSTHDSDTLVLWWKNSPEEAKAYCATKNWTYTPQITPDQLKEILHDSHHSTSLFHINLLQEYLSLFRELSHEDPNEERINIPGMINDKNWCYRFLPSLEEIIAHEDLKKFLRNMS